MSPCAVANDAETRKSIKYSLLSAQYCFVPVVVETLGVSGDEALAFFRDFGQRIAAAITAEPRSFPVDTLIGDWHHHSESRVAVKTSHRKVRDLSHLTSFCMHLADSMIPPWYANWGRGAWLHIPAEPLYRR
jgi:hypothetical protein